jgi:hypothetical protein
MPMELCAVRVAAMPFAERKDILRALPAEIEAAVPWDLDAMILAPRILEAGPRGSRTSAVIVPRADVRARIDTFAAAHAEPRVVVADADALATYGEAGVQAVLDIGHRRTVVALAQDGRLVAARVVPSGGAAWTEAIAGATGVAWDHAEAAKHGARLPAADEPAPTGWEAVLIEAVERWSVDLRAALIALEDESGLGIDEVLLCGGASRLDGLAGRVGATLGVPVRPVLVPGGHPVDFALAVALARVGAGEVQATDLRLGDLSYHGHAETLWRVTLGAVGVGAVAFVALIGVFVSQVVKARAELDAADAEVVAAVQGALPDVPATRVAGQPTMALALLQESLAASRARVDALGDTLGGVPPTLDLLRLVSENVPAPDVARVDVREMTIAEDAVSFKAETDSYEAAAKIEEGLRRSARLQTARKSEEKKVGDVVTFTVNIPLEAEDAAAAGDAPAEAPAGAAPAAGGGE